LPIYMEGDRCIAQAFCCELELKNHCQRPWSRSKFSLFKLNEIVKLAHNEFSKKWV